ncbi:hypothetical protein ACHAXH_000267, partial [Discostella pseudostelligera]
MPRPRATKPQPVTGATTTSGDGRNSNRRGTITSTIDNPTFFLGGVGACGDEGGNDGGGGGELLLERLRILLHRLQVTTEILQNWPEARGDSARVHADTCTELIVAIRKIALGLRGVERHVNGTGPAASAAAAVTIGANSQTGDGGGKALTSSTMKEASSIPSSSASSEEFRTYLETSCPIPLDLLDLLDVGPQQNPFGLHPSCYARGLMEESLHQLARLERRRRALRMLANSIEGGMMMMMMNRSTPPTVKNGVS